MFSHLKIPVNCFLRYKILNMDKKVNLSKLASVNHSNKLKTDATDTAVKVEKQILQGVASPYFSPRRTRNQRKHIKIQSDVDYQENKAFKKSINPVASTSKDDKNTEKKIKSELEEKKSANPVVDTVLLQNKFEQISESVDSKQAKWEPKNWQKMLENMREMRKNRSAPVDTMGCHMCADTNADEKTQRFHNLISLMLSSQTKDNVTYDAMNRLKEHGLTPQTMSEINLSELETLLNPVSFYKTKAKHIQKTANILIESYESDIPNNVKELIKLPGVGPKMAHICMKVAWNITSGIGVDTHVHRISNRLKWMPKETKEPEKTRIALENWLPFELWSEVNELMVGFGQTVCTPTNPKCGECLNYDICPSKVIKNKK